MLFMKMRKFVTAMFALAALLCIANVRTFAQAESTDTTPEAQFEQLKAHFEGGSNLSRQFASAATSATGFSIIADGVGISKGGVPDGSLNYVMGAPGTALQITVKNPVGVCQFGNTFTGERWTTTNPRTFTLTLDENSPRLLTGGYISGECDSSAGRATAGLFIHIFNRFGAISVLEVSGGFAGSANTLRFAYGVGPTQSPVFGWKAEGGVPASGTTDAFGSFSVSFATGGFKTIEGQFGPDPNRGGKTFLSRVPFFSVGTPGLIITRDRMGIVLRATEEANITEGTLTLELRGPRIIQLISFDIEGIAAGEKVRVNLPNQLRSLSGDATYVTIMDGHPMVWDQGIPMMRQELPSRQLEQ